MIFVGPGLFRHFGLPAPISERLVLASHSHITPLLSHLMPQQEFYVLAIGKKLLRLLQHYFQIVDRALTGFLKDRPIVLVGIAQKLAAYRSMSKYPHLLTAEPTSPEHLSWAELEEHGRQAVLEVRRGEAERALGEFRKRPVAIMSPAASARCWRTRARAAFIG